MRKTRRDCGERRERFRGKERLQGRGEGEIYLGERERNCVRERDYKEWDRDSGGRERLGAVRNYRGREIARRGRERETMER